MRSRVISLLLFGVLITGCASDPGTKPEEEREAAYTAVRSADDAGAMDVEPSIMNTAREKLEAARVLVEEQRYDEARQLLDEATLDARLAESRTQTQEVRNELGDLQTSIESLRSNLESQQ